MAIALLALALLATVAFHILSGCAALQTAAPILLEATERVLLAELDAARDAAREEELQRALALLRECREAQAAAEAAARRATEAAVLAQEAAERAEREREATERARGEVAKYRLRLSLRRLGVVGSVEPAGAQ